MMNNNYNLPIIQEKGIFNNIRLFFRKLFYKEKYEIDKDFTNTENFTKNIPNNNFKDTIKTEVKGEYSKKIEKEEYLKKLEENPKLLYNISNDRLKILKDYYIEKNRKLDYEIEIEKNKNNKLRRTS